MIDISCIIINYNTSNYTTEAVKSILDFHENDLSLEIIVVDNCSKIDDYLLLKESLEQLNNHKVKLYRSRINTGFGGGNMYGVLQASPSNYYAFINNDTLQISKNCLKRLKEFMVNTPDAAVCSPQMLDQHKNFSVTIDHFSSLKREIIKRPLLEKLNPKKYLNRKITYTKPTAVHYVQGSFLFVDAKEFDAVGGFDTNIFLYYEESDLCLRLLKERGKKTYLIPDVEYIHYKNASTPRTALSKTEMKISLLYTIKKHYGYFAHQLLLNHLRVKYFFSFIVKPKHFYLFKVLLKGGGLNHSLKLKQKIEEL